MIDDPETFGNLIRRLRLEAGLGLRELARLIERSPGYLSDVESGNGSITLRTPEAAAVVSLETDGGITVL